MSDVADDSGEKFCAELVRTQDFPSYAATLFVSREARRSLLALAAFNSEVAHVRDHVSQPLPGEIRLQWWRDVLTGEGQGAQRSEIKGNPVAAELLRVISLHDLSVETLVRLIDAHVFDVYDDPMPDMAALEAHCRDTSAALYALRARILGANSPEVERLADRAGIAEGLTRVMLDLPRHAARRQLYLPADLINLHGGVTEEIFLHQTTPALNDALAHLRREACAQIEQLWLDLERVLPTARAAFLLIPVIEKILTRLEVSDPFTPPALSRLRVLWTMWRAGATRPFKA